MAFHKSKTHPVVKGVPSLNGWNTFAGGTFAAEEKSSYDIRMPGGIGPNGEVQITITPIASTLGYHRGYSLMAAGLPGASGLWSWIDLDGSFNGNGIARLFSKPQEAVKIAQQVYQAQVLLSKNA